jgi:hypothetical protein
MYFFAWQSVSFWKRTATAKEKQEVLKLPYRIYISDKKKKLVGIDSSNSLVKQSPQHN